MNDIVSYVRKTTLVADEDSLLREVDQEESPPDYITFEDIPPVSTQFLPVPATMRGPAHSQSDLSSKTSRESQAPSADVLSGSRKTSVTSHQSSPHWQVVNHSESGTREPSPLLQAEIPAINDDFDMAYDYDSSPAASIFPPTQPALHSFHPVILGQDAVGPANVLNLAQAFVQPELSHSTMPASDYFHSLVSPTSPQRLFDTAANQLSWELPEVLYEILHHHNKYAQLDEDPLQDANTSGFFLHTVYACILRNQSRTIEADGEFAAAAFDFGKIVDQQVDNCLSVLGSVMALLESYGQRMGAREILRRVFQMFSRNTKGKSPFIETLAFMCQTQIPEYGSKGTYDIETLRWIHLEFHRLHGNRSRLTLTAQFNVAWALLECQDYSSARNLLIELKTQCETVFGPYHIQTIMASATLARAHLYNEEYRSAEMMIQESVISRVARTFSSSHPYYWEAKFRQAAFMKMRGMKEQNPKTQRSLMQQSESLLREVLIWRTTILGTANPRTNSTFRVLKNLLEGQGKYDEATFLYDWAVRECQPRREELFQKDFSLI